MYDFKKLGYIVIFIVILATLIYEKQHPDCYKQKNSDYMKATHSGVLRGAILGGIMSGNIYTAVQNGVIFGVINPVMLYMGY